MMGTILCPSYTDRFSYNSKDLAQLRKDYATHSAALAVLNEARSTFTALKKESKNSEVIFQSLQSCVDIDTQIDDTKEYMYGVIVDGREMGFNRKDII